MEVPGWRKRYLGGGVERVWKQDLVRNEQGLSVQACNQPFVVGNVRGKCKSRIVSHNEAKTSEKAEFTGK
ncbi:MAG: hypothetical protein BECKG1743D_GA0114223_101302 [Candidatus Kentron sp. G]|nr:MAG: hypothetical protein BECKG1743D_GA0114223_101302 [Candidatus Kentron sp. G]